ncbi:MAG: ATP-binding protein [Bacteroidota bacterium]|jgi:two-component system NtrC family sensor kinase|nr:HAMP domain-containing protein [Ignavibacteria bacterium]MCU7499734.1 HAMP domain-containing protein [Ignavibacteria bacterium]MCU7513380.1 HAMP domain-containing protein [Ignavibacteria bacterium]MCU7519871.1 HAMP domain-containing protein [Ignavibacteria bacterium]MCU7524133.1 HAMP domain-containing protein [Ignavibacteria bacterium]
MKIKFYNKLSFKLILVISLILLVNLGFQTIYTLTTLEKDLTNSYSQNAYNMSDIIKKSTRYSMLLNHSYDVHQIIKTIGTETGVEKIRIYNKLGRVIFSTDSTEISSLMNKNAEACVACHSDGKHVSILPVKDKIRLFRKNDGSRVLGLINPIYNEDDCWNSGCHAHDKNVKILGVLDVVISMKEADSIISSNISNVVATSILVTLIIAIAIWLFISIVVNRPVKKITKGIEELGKGNLNYKIDVRSQNELGKMAGQFNDMGSKLDLAYKEIKEWSETLNEKVKEKTEELKKIYDQIIQIEKLASLGKLSATVAHELNNPLEGILTYSKLISRKIQKQPESDENKKLLEFLELISDESSRCGRIVKDLLLFSHRGEDEFNSENIVSIIDKCIQLINHHLEIHKIKLVTDYPEECVKINVDSQKIQQALMSLLINAIEAMAHGGCIKVSVVNEKEYVAIRIIDEGSGIMPEHLPHIFEPFYSTKQKKGTGLGLAVAYGIIEHHKGKIEVESTSPKGTTIKVSLPLRKNNSRDQHEK